jgi:peptidoglycan/LPS O-acetylase OafA/YrhL
MLKRIKSLDGVRGLAVSMVIISHLMFLSNYNENFLWKFLKNGWMGVDLFFVLSGYLITSILIASKSKKNYFRNFLIRRTLRIFPLYYTVLIIVLISLFFYQNGNFQNLIWYFTYTSNIGMAINDNWLHVGGNLELSHFWSLAVEEQFYLFWPLIIYIIPNKYIPFLAFLMVICGPEIRVLIGEWMNSKTMSAYVMTPARMDSLAGGALLASLYQSDVFSSSLQFRKISWSFLVAGFVTTIGGLLFWNFGIICAGLFAISIASWIKLEDELISWIALTITGIFAIGTIYQYVGVYIYSYNILFFVNIIHVVQKHRNKITIFLFENRVALELGKYSYAMYIFHHLFQHQWKWLTRDVLHLDILHPLIFQVSFIVIATSLTYGAALITWRLIEKPFQDLKLKFESE